jgi:hypothetical protein
LKIRGYNARRVRARDWHPERYRDDLHLLSRVGLDARLGALAGRRVLDLDAVILPRCKQAPVVGAEGHAVAKVDEPQGVLQEWLRWLLIWPGWAEVPEAGISPPQGSPVCASSGLQEAVRPIGL